MAADSRAHMSFTDKDMPCCISVLHMFTYRARRAQLLAPPDQATRPR